MYNEELRDLYTQEKLICWKNHEVGRAWRKQDKYLEMFGGNAGIKHDSSCCQEQNKVDILYIGQ
jgi:hypothetical protein